MLNNYPKTFTLLQMQYGCSGATTWGNARFHFYNGNNTPLVMFDGMERCQGHIGGGTTPQYEWYEGVYQDRYEILTDVTIKIRSLQTVGTNFRFWADVCIEPGGTSKTMRIYMVQVLDHWPSGLRNGFKLAAGNRRYHTVSR